MKRLLTFAGALLLGATIFGGLRRKEQNATQAFADIQHQREESRYFVASEGDKQTKLRDEIAASPRLAVGNAEQFSPALAKWLLASNYSTMPRTLALELRRHLSPSDFEDAQYVLISKSSLKKFDPIVIRDNKVTDAVCELLSIAPNQRDELDSALASANRQYYDWAARSLQINGPDPSSKTKGQKDDAALLYAPIPSTDLSVAVAEDKPNAQTWIKTGADQNIVASYTVPGDTQVAASITNQLVSAVADALGSERTEFLGDYANAWYQSTMAGLGAFTNTLTILKKSGSDGQSDLLYAYSMQGYQYSMRMYPRPISPATWPDQVMPFWTNLFPGGWQEIAERGGFQLPADGKNSAK